MAPLVSGALADHSVNHRFDDGTPTGGNDQAANPGATVGPPPAPLDDRGDLGDLFNAFTF